MTRLCMVWNVEKVQTALFHSQANGIVGRNNKLMTSSVLCLRGQDAWD